MIALEAPSINAICRTNEYEGEEIIESKIEEEEKE